MSLIEQTVEILSSAKSAVGFTGAGISAESGIATYRDADGLWSRYGNQGILNVLAMYPEMAPQILGDFFSRLKNARPNAAHRALTELEKQGRLISVITQNIDNLHRSAGSRKVYELHGSLFRLRCMRCDSRRNLESQELFSIVENAIAHISVLPGQGFSLETFARYFPVCECQGSTRLDFVSFGESVQDFGPARLVVQECDIMLIIGTSGVVEPAASLPEIAKEKGACLIEINAADSELTSICDLSLRGPAAKIMTEIMEGLRLMSSSERHD